jgi:hypothetical protein
MIKFNCVFCGEQLLADCEIKDETAKAICDSCFAKGGRLPGTVWEVSVDKKGRPRIAARQEFLTSKIHLKIAIGILTVILIGVPLAGLFVSPGQSIIVFSLYYAAYVINKHFGKRRRSGK